MARPCVNLNDVIIVHDEKLPRSRWRLGVVIKLIEGKDKQIRGAVVRTANGSELTRPVNKLFPVETTLNDRNNREGKTNDVSNYEVTLTENTKDPERILAELPNAKTEIVRTKCDTAFAREHNRRSARLNSKIDHVNLPGECKI